MPITPIELLSIAPKSQEASFYKSAELQKPVNEQITLSQQMQEASMRKSEQISNINRPDEPEYRYNASEGGSNGFLYEKNGNKKHKKEKKEEEAGKPKMSGFDIKI